MIGSGKGVSANGGFATAKVWNQDLSLYSVDCNAVW